MGLEKRKELRFSVMNGASVEGEVVTIPDELGTLFCTTKGTLEIEGSSLTEGLNDGWLIAWLEGSLLGLPLE